jgi:CubicO group peptidase (beta-lactamase class C family)
VSLKPARYELEDSLKSALSQWPVPGASIAILENGRLESAVTGVTNTTTGVPVTADTVMHIGSITKIFTATLLMQLVDEGKLDLDQSVMEYLAPFKLHGGSLQRQLSARMLLNHSSGIDGELLPGLDHDEETIQRAAQRIAKLDQLFSPGTRFSYCNAGFVLAGYLAEQITGKSWYRLIRERIFEPLGMKHSATLPEEAILHRTSVGHFVQEAKDFAVTRTNAAFLPLSFAPCGTTLMMSAADLLKFATVHMNQGIGANGVRILSGDGTDAMQRIGLRHKVGRYVYGDGIGLGWMVFDDGLLHHSGGGPGISAALYVLPEERRAIAILTNAEYRLSWRFIGEIVAPWLRERRLAAYEQMTQAFPIPSADPIKIERFVAVYRDNLYRYRVSASPDGQLNLSSQATFAPYENMSTLPTDPTPLIHLGNNDFILSVRDESLPTPNFYRLFAFQASTVDGPMEYLGNGMRLYRRETAAQAPVWNETRG